MSLGLVVHSNKYNPLPLSALQRYDAGTEVESRGASRHLIAQTLIGKAFQQHGSLGATVTKQQVECIEADCVRLL